MSRKPQLSTSSLLVACAGGPAGGGANWNQLVDRIAPNVRFGVLGALARCCEPCEPELVDDLMQEVWCRLLDRRRGVLARYRGTDDRSAAVFVQRVATHVAIDQLRANFALKRRPRCLLPLDRCERARPTVDRRFCPERRLLARERVMELVNLWRELLGPRTRRPGLKIATWAWVEGLSSIEIAERLDAGWSASRIDALLFRLRRRLNERGIELPNRANERSIREPARVTG